MEDYLDRSNESGYEGDPRQDENSVISLGSNDRIQWLTLLICGDCFMGACPLAS
jgi:hypothetical protein